MSAAMFLHVVPALRRDEVGIEIDGRLKAAVVPLAQHMIHDEMASMSILIHVRLDISPAVVSDDVGSSRDL